jgi:hypothetical protein
MNRRRLAALERLLRPRLQPTCMCILAYCPEAGETMPLLEVDCDHCGRWRDPQTACLIEEIIVETRAGVETLFANHPELQR